MDVLLVFTDNGRHRLSPLLERGFRHVFAVIHSQGQWVVHNWKSGTGLEVSVIADESYSPLDMVEFYANEGHTTVWVKASDQMRSWPMMVNNCVSHTKQLLGINSFAVTPYQLYKSVMKRPVRPAQRWSFASLPGGGAFSAPKPPAPPPPPPPQPAPPRKTDPAVREARDDQKKRARMKAGHAGNVKSRGLLKEDATTTDTLLSE